MDEDRIEVGPPVVEWGLSDDALTSLEGVFTSEESFVTNEDQKSMLLEHDSSRESINQIESYAGTKIEMTDSSGAEECSSVETIKLACEAATRCMEDSISNLSMLGGVNSQLSLGSVTPSQAVLLDHQTYIKNSVGASFGALTRKKSFYSLHDHLVKLAALKLKGRSTPPSEEEEEPFNSNSEESTMFQGDMHQPPLLPRELLLNKIKESEMKSMKDPVPKGIRTMLRKARSSKSENSRLFGVVKADTRSVVSLDPNCYQRKSSAAHHSGSRSVSAFSFQLRKSCSSTMSHPQTPKMSPIGSKNYIRENIAKVSSKPPGLEDAMRPPFPQRSQISGITGLPRVVSIQAGAHGITAAPQRLKNQNVVYTRPAHVGVLSPTAPIPDQKATVSPAPASPTPVEKFAKVRPGTPAPASPTPVEKFAKVRPGTPARKKLFGAIPKEAPETTSPTAKVKLDKKQILDLAKRTKVLKKKAVRPSAVTSSSSLENTTSPYIAGEIRPLSTTKHGRIASLTVKKSKKKSVDEDGAAAPESRRSKTRKLSKPKFLKKRRPAKASDSSELDPYYVEATPSDKVMINELVRADLEKILERDAYGFTRYDDQPPGLIPEPKAEKRTKERRDLIGSPYAIKSAPLPRRKKIGVVQPQVVKRPGTAASGISNRGGEEHAELVLKGLKKPMKKSKVTTPGKPK